VPAEVKSDKRWGKKKRAWDGNQFPARARQPMDSKKKREPTIEVLPSPSSKKGKTQKNSFEGHCELHRGYDRERGKHNEREKKKKTGRKRDNLTKKSKVLSPRTQQNSC